MGWKARSAALGVRQARDCSNRGREAPGASEAKNDQRWVVRSTHRGGVEGLGPPKNNKGRPGEVQSTEQGRPEPVAGDGFEPP
jgi:hypothetical protein